MNYTKTMQFSYAMNYAFSILVSNFLRAEFHEKPASNRQIRIFSALKTKYGLGAVAMNYSKLQEKFSYKTNLKLSCNFKDKTLRKGHFCTRTKHLIMHCFSNFDKFLWHISLNHWYSMVLRPQHVKNASKRQKRRDTVPTRFTVQTLRRFFVISVAPLFLVCIDSCLI